LALDGLNVTGELGDERSNLIATALLTISLNVTSDLASNWL
jgi:hypothetical protein